MTQQHARTGFVHSVLTALILVAVAIAPVLGGARTALAKRQPLAAIVVDARSGKVLFARDADSPRYPASISKVMTLYLLFRELKAGRLSLHSRLKVSRRAALKPPSKLWLKPGQTITVDQAIRALAVKSANDVAAVVAENLAGSESAFARRMTRMARALGMTRTTFRNASGLPTPPNVSTARDLATLSLRLMRDFPRLYKKYFGLKYFTWRGKRLRNHNGLLWRVRGMDGIKTGYTRAAGSNLAASVRHGRKRIVAVVLGAPSSRWRNRYMARLIERAFRHYRLTPGTRIAALAGSPPGWNARRARVLMARVDAGVAWRSASAKRRQNFGNHRRQGRQAYKHAPRPAPRRGLAALLADRSSGQRRTSRDDAARNRIAKPHPDVRPRPRPAMLSRRARGSDLSVSPATSGESPASRALAALSARALRQPYETDTATDAANIARQRQGAGSKADNRAGPANRASGPATGNMMRDKPAESPLPPELRTEEVNVTPKRALAANNRMETGAKARVSGRPVAVAVHVRVREAELDPTEMAEAARPEMDAAELASTTLAALERMPASEPNRASGADEGRKGGDTEPFETAADSGTLVIAKTMPPPAPRANAGEKVAVPSSPPGRPESPSMTGRMTRPAPGDSRDAAGGVAVAARTVSDASEGAAPRHEDGARIVVGDAVRAQELMARKWLIQIGAFPTLEGARKYLHRARKLSRYVRGEYPLVIRVERNGKVFYRARYAGMSRQQARRACRELKRRGISCLPMAPGKG